MQQELILYPALAVAMLTFSVGLALYLSRRLAVKRGELNPGYFLLNRGGRPPEYLIRLEQNYTNLFELPVLFYVAVLLLYTTGSADRYQLWLLWGFALSRILHSLIHVSVNRLRWRMYSFMLGFLLLFASWTSWLFQLAQ